jgi:sodium/potassium-transporting ATPase subunit alpha
MVNLFVLKTRKLSFFTQGIDNGFMIFSIITEICLILAAAYILPLNVVFGTRDNVYMHFGTPAIPFALLLMVND